MSQWLHPLRRGADAKAYAGARRAHATHSASKRTCSVKVPQVARAVAVEFLSGAFSRNPASGALAESRQKCVKTARHCRGASMLAKFGPTLDQCLFGRRLLPHLVKQISRHLPQARKHKCPSSDRTGLRLR